MRAIKGYYPSKRIMDMYPSIGLIDDNIFALAAFSYTFTVSSTSKGPCIFYTLYIKLTKYHLKKKMSFYLLPLLIWMSCGDENNPISGNNNLGYFFRRSIANWEIDDRFLITT